MATWKYGPETVVEDSGGYCGPENHTYEVQYQTTADILSVLRDGEWEAGWEYNSSRTIAKMIAKWFLVYELSYDNDFVDKLLSGKYEVKD